MTPTDHSTDRTTPREQALHWFSKVQLGTLTLDERRELDAWLARDPAHEREYRSLQDVWKVADYLPMDEMRAIMDKTDDDRPQPGRRRMLISAGATCVAVATAGWLTYDLWAPFPTFTQQLITLKGERRKIGLPDGSHIDLNTDTDISIAFYDARRTVELHRGEALFSISHDTARPFLVEAGDARVLVTGTQFDVRRDQGRVMVAVQEGSVEFSAGPWWRRKQALLTAGQVSVASPQDGLISPYPDHVETITAWQRGRLVFRDVPLSDVAAELSRYLTHPLRIADTRLGQLRISGTLSIETPEAALDILPDIAPVAVIRHADGDVILVMSR